MELYQSLDVIKIIIFSIYIPLLLVLAYSKRWKNWKLFDLQEKKWSGLNLGLLCYFLFYILYLAGDWYFPDSDTIWDSGDTTVTAILQLLLTFLAWLTWLKPNVKEAEVPKEFHTLSKIMWASLIILIIRYVIACFDVFVPASDLDYLLFSMDMLHNGILIWAIFIWKTELDKEQTGNYIALLTKRTQWVIGLLVFNFFYQMFLWALYWVAAFELADSFNDFIYLIYFLAFIFTVNGLAVQKGDKAGKYGCGESAEATENMLKM